ncbi:chromate transporter, chromate ion transporter (CHR) family [Aedoeadaptatus ivorii]|uniref:Chromate transporter, chromate ion transporter (CHR) family n=1 Tax=Aedoeadaptatus ivorii TaxID=54006 RepID=A0A3S4YJR3_9FIRM|nr:chromate transporter [Peptoniphilus ivorii]MDQ0508480.1 chromate transporter [Peptoniphilus ivorii]VEJ34255.1 chromate transporter, chromate ion transporter (CHR) family [Peptoniphilus ivorii]
MERKVSLVKLFLTFLKINTFTFGGGYTIVPIIRDEFVEKQKLIPDDEMLDLVALAQSGPGAMAISTSLLTGYRLRGAAGAFVCLLASVTPCLVIILTINMAYARFRSNFYVNAALVGISGVISAVLLLTTWNLGKKALETDRLFSCGMIALALGLGLFTDVNTALVILMMGFAGIFLTKYESSRERNRDE